MLNLSTNIQHFIHKTASYDVFSLWNKSDGKKPFQIFLKLNFNEKYSFQKKTSRNSTLNTCKFFRNSKHIAVGWKRKL